MIWVPLGYWVLGRYNASSTELPGSIEVSLYCHIVVWVCSMQILILGRVYTCMCVGSMVCELCRCLCGLWTHRNKNLTKIGVLRGCHAYCWMVGIPLHRQ